MTALPNRLFFTLVVTAALMMGGQALAQSSQDMSLLTEPERVEFTRRLQHTSSSAERAKITAEMNRVVQERRLDLRRAKDAKTQTNTPQKNEQPAH